MSKAQGLTVALAGATWFCAGCDLPNGDRWPQTDAASVEDAAPAAEIVPTNGLRLTLTMERSDYELGEPVYAAVVLENTGTRSRRVFGQLRPEDGAVTLFVASGDAEPRTFSPLGHADNDGTVWAELEPGGQIGATAPVFFGSDGWTFVEPGEYRLTAVYSASPDGKSVEQVGSEPVALSVRAGDRAGQLLVADDSASLEAGRFLTWQAGDHLGVGRQLLDELMERWPDSRHASHAAFALGRSWSEPFMDYSKNQVRAPDCERALGLLDRVDQDVVGTQAKALIHVARARCAAGSGDRKTALEQLERGRELVEGRPELAGVWELLGEYADNLVDEPGRQPGP